MPGMEWARVKIFQLDEYIGSQARPYETLGGSGGAQLLSRRAGRTENVPQRYPANWHSSRPLNK